MAGWGFVIDLIAQRKVFPEAPDLAYYKGFSEVVSTMAVFAANCNQSVKFTFDMRKESEYNSAYLYNMFREWPDMNVDIFRNVTFACSRDEPKLQVADLWTRETMKALDNSVGPVKRPKRKSWEALEKTERFKIEAISEDWFLSLKGQMPTLQKESGFESVRYVQWLNRNKLQDSTTNMFRFLEVNLRERP